MHASKAAIMTRLSEQGPQTFRMFWAGPALSAYEELCLNSFVARGHQVLLYSPARLHWVPDGVTQLDASDILPAKELYQFVFPNGESTPSIHANLFRYEALRQLGGWYVDTDVVLLRDDPPAGDSYFAWEDETSINNAVLRFPPGTPLMQAAAETAQDLMGATVWGMSGPRLLTRLAHELNLTSAARPWTAAYPVRTTEVIKLFDPDHREELEERLAKADFLHLWNQIWRRIRIPKELGPPEGSYLDSLFRKFNVRVPPYARLSHRAVASWFHDFNLLADLPRERESAAQAAAAQAQKAAAQAQAAAAQAQAQAAADIQRQSERAALLERTAELSACLDYVRWERDEVLRSTSWRITRPLRAVIDRFRKARGGG